MPLRDYQQRAIDLLYKWFEHHHSGNPCLVLPTGSGKSWIIAELCKNSLQNWPDTRILMLSHVKEIIQQDLDKLLQVWPGAPVGVYSAGLGSRRFGSITFAGIQSVRSRADEIGHVDLCIVDECHLVSHKSKGGYRHLIDRLQQINPALRVIGLTATPYRLGHGLITDDPALFDDLIEPVRIEELVSKGFLAPLRSKATDRELTVDGVGRRGGEYIERDLQRAVDTGDNNAAVVSEIVRIGRDRRSWLLFCCGVDHARKISGLLTEDGIRSACVTGETPKAERDQILSDFKAGTLRAVTNANVLTTGFDHPGLDLIAMLRPTLSPGLYVQMAGRGMRPAAGKTDCLVLDFAGVVAAHGPIVAVEPPKKAGNGPTVTKRCPECSEIVSGSSKECPACGHEFVSEDPSDKDLTLRHDDIMGTGGRELSVTSWRWQVHTGRASGVKMLKVTYYGGLSDPAITEYLTIKHTGYAGQRAIRELGIIASESSSSPFSVDTLEAAAEEMNAGRPPERILYRRDGKFHRVYSRLWGRK